MPLKDKKRLLEYRKEYYQERKEWINERNRRYRLNHSDLIKKQKHEYYLKRRAVRRQGISGPCQRCNAVTTTFRDGIPLWFKQSDGLILCSKCHASKHIPIRSGAENNFYGKKGSDHPSWRDKSDRVCYCCGSNKTHLKSDGTYMWIMNKMNTGLVTWLCNVCWNNIESGHWLAHPNRHEERVCYCCGSNKTKYDKKRGIYLWALNYPSSYVLCHYCYMDLKNNRPIRTYYCDECFSDVWKLDYVKQKVTTYWWKEDNGQMAELCRSCYHTKHIQRIWDERKSREIAVLVKTQELLTDDKA